MPMRGLRRKRRVGSPDDEERGMVGVPTKVELLARSRAARAAWEAVLDRVPRDRLAAPGAAGAWSAKDVQAHLTTNNRWMAGQLRALARGALPTAAECYGHERTPPRGTDLADQEQRNAWWHSIDRKRPLEEVLAEGPRWATALEEAITALPEEEFARPYTFADYHHLARVRPARDGEPSWPLGAIIASYADEHYAPHTDELRRALEGGLFGGSP
jgi:hypothetical protein